MTDQPTTPSQRPAPRWQPLEPTDRRVVGVLMEKAKTSESGYPMTLNAIVTGCNQKSNRHPITHLDEEDVDASLERLRKLGAVGMIEGHGRVAKYRHYMYDWLGVDKLEMAVMTELLLRGPQSEGDLRARAARMEPIRDLGELRPIVAALKTKGLVLPLTPEGRGHVVTHALHLDREMEKIERQHAAMAVPSAGPGDTDEDEETDSQPRRLATNVAAAAPPRGEAAAELAALRNELAQLRSDVSDITASVSRMADELSQLKRDLGVG